MRPGPVRKKLGPSTLAATLVAALTGLFATTVALAAPPARHTDFSGVWRSAGPDYAVLPEQNAAKFTPDAARGLEYYRAHFHPGKDDPAVVCLLKGMPWTILLRPRDYPVEIYQTPERVVMFFELYDTHRNILLGEKTFPDDVPPSGNGYSIAHWEGDALVIETRNLTATNPVTPYPRSEEARIVERWTRGTDAQLGDVLRVDITVHDPRVFTEPGRGWVTFHRSPPGTRVGGYNCSEQLWDNYVDKRRAEVEGRAHDGPEVTRTHEGPLTR